MGNRACEWLTGCPVRGSKTEKEVRGQQGSGWGGGEGRLSIINIIIIII